jgi:hypothetical protein
LAEKSCNYEASSQDARAAFSIDCRHSDVRILEVQAAAIRTRLALTRAKEEQNAGWNHNQNPVHKHNGEKTHNPKN